MKTTIKVTQDLIDSGVRLSSVSCPIAKALRLAGYECTVTQTDVSFYLHKHSENRYATSQLPAMARLFVRNFDDGNPVNPFEFELEVFNP